MEGHSFLIFSSRFVGSGGDGKNQCSHPESWGKRWRMVPRKPGSGCSSRITSSHTSRMDTSIIYDAGICCCLQVSLILVYLPPWVSLYPDHSFQLRSTETRQQPPHALELANDAQTSDNLLIHLLPSMNSCVYSKFSLGEDCGFRRSIFFFF